MRVFLDTNILFSAILFPDSVPDKALQKALCFPYEVVTCDYVLDELRRNVIKKFPTKVDALDRFIASLALSITVINVSYNVDDDTLSIRDDYDKPVLRAALESKCDLLISGDKDFLEAGLDKPVVIKAADFYYKY